MEQEIVIDKGIKIRDKFEENNLSLALFNISFDEIYSRGQRV